MEGDGKHLQLRVSSRAKSPGLIGLKQKEKNNPKLQNLLKIKQ